MIAISYRQNPDSAVILGGRKSPRYGHHARPRKGLDLICRTFKTRLDAAAYLAAAPDLAATGKFHLTEIK